MKNLLLVLVLSLGILSCTNKEDGAKELIRQEWNLENVELFLDESHEMLQKAGKEVDNPEIAYQLIYRVLWSGSDDTLFYKASFDKELERIISNTDQIPKGEIRKIEDQIRKNAEIDTLIDLYNVLG